MSSKPQSRVPWLSRFKKRVSSVLTPSHPASPSAPHSHLPSNDAADAEVSLSPGFHHPSASVSSTSVPSTAHVVHEDSTRHAAGSSRQHDTSMLLMHPTRPQLPPGQGLSYQGPSHMFGGAHDFVVNNAVFNDYNPAADSFMKELLRETIIGAEFDSSARDPPPRCHPGTRLAIIQRCIDFINQCTDEGKLRWVVGPAGVGKSAVMQMVTETAPEGVIFASIFLSVNGRRDGKKAIITMAYQFAVKCGPYHRFIRDQISLDPSLLGKLLSVQFNKFIVEPFILKPIFEPSRRFLVVIDGLDECDDPLTQRKLLELITGCCIAYPTSPIAWIIASRPEPHITSFFERAEVQPVYTKEEIKIDSDEACKEVQQYLRDELTKIKLEHPTLRYKREWPLENEFTKIAASAGGLFAYAATVIRYIGDPIHASPAAQLRRVLETIDASAKDHAAGRDHPMDRLDALYKRILSNVPDDVMINTRKLLLMGFDYDFSGVGFRMRCNALQLSEEDACDAIRHLHAVMKIPELNKADEKLSSYHKSFDDFLSDFGRSGFSRDIDSERSQLCDYTCLRIVEELQDGSDGVTSGKDIELWSGFMKSHCGNISLSWPDDKRFQVTDDEMRVKLYILAIRQLVTRLPWPNSSLHENISCFYVLTMRFTTPPFNFPFYKVRECAFGQFRDELANLGKLKQVPLRTLDYAAICGDVELRATGPTGGNIMVSAFWEPSCDHKREGLDGLERWQGWSTKFQRHHRANSRTKEDEDSNIPHFNSSTVQQRHRRWVEGHTGRSDTASACIHCSRRLSHLVVNNPDLPAMVFVDSTQMCYVEVSFVDPDDGVSEWRYRFLHSGCPSSVDV